MSKYKGVKCSVENCTTQAKDKNMCGKHAQRLRRYGDVNYVTPQRVMSERNRLAQPKFRVLKDTTYKKHFGRHEHRVIAEEKIGRALRPGEIVHHVDGNKHNNSPDNLRVMTQSEHLKEHFQEMLSKKKKKTHCPMGHAYSGDNLRLTKTGGQVCRECMRQHQKKWKEKNA